MPMCKRIYDLQAENARLTKLNESAVNAQVRANEEIAQLTEQLAAAIAFSDENIERLTKLHGEALARIAALEEILPGLTFQVHSYGEDEMGHYVLLRVDHGMWDAFQHAGSGGSQ